MVTVDKYLKIYNADYEETEKLIDEMSEQDAKDYLKSLMKVIKQHKVSIDEIQ